MPLDLVWVGDCEHGVGQDKRHVGLGNGLHASLDLGQLVRSGAIDFVDDHQVGHAQVGLAWMVAGLISRTVGVDQYDVEVRPDHLGGRCCRRPR